MTCCDSRLSLNPIRSYPSHWLKDALSHLFHIHLSLFDPLPQGFDLHGHEEGPQGVGLFFLLVVDALRVFEPHPLDILIKVLILVA